MHVELHTTTEWGAPHGVLGPCVSCRPTDCGSNPGHRTVYYFLTRKINITRGKPLAPTIISRGEIQGVKKFSYMGIGKAPSIGAADTDLTPVIKKSISCI